MYRLIDRYFRAANLSRYPATTQIKLQETENGDQTEESKVTHHSDQCCCQGEVIQQVPVKIRETRLDEEC